MYNFCQNYLEHLEHLEISDQYETKEVFRGVGTPLEHLEHPGTQHVAYMVVQSLTRLRRDWHGPTNASQFVGMNAIDASQPNASQFEVVYR